METPRPLVVYTGWFLTGKAATLHVNETKLTLGNGLADGIACGETRDGGTEGQRVKGPGRRLSGYTPVQTDYDLKHYPNAPPLSLNSSYL